METGYDHLKTIVSGQTSPDQRVIAIKGFAQELSWTPSYEISNTFGVDGAEEHLVVEHGLENAAIISFIKSPVRPSDLNKGQLKSLLTLSYNNLVEWHILTSDTEVCFYNNLTDPTYEKFTSISRTNFDALRSGFFNDVVKGNRLSKNIPSCEDFLIKTISNWKRLIKADYREADNSNISALMNAIIFIRGCEDQQSSSSDSFNRLLLSVLQRNDEGSVNLSELFRNIFIELNIEQNFDGFINAEKLQVFNTFDYSTASELFQNFYRPTLCPYEFNFALMSKHALSRIYERYVSLLDFDEDIQEQTSFLPTVPREKITKKTGTVYTPQFIAGFFSRYLRENMTPRKFRSLKSLDPACGSGIFSRTLLELQCEPLQGMPSQHVDLFSTVTAIDRDPNACEATKLSLSLLFLVLTGRLPTPLNIKCLDPIKTSLENPESFKDFGAILANPPYIKYDHLPEEDRIAFSQFLGQYAKGRIDSYLAFVKLCLDAVEPGGFVCLVLPHSFLLADNARKLREKISSEFFIRCLVDLTLIPVFEDTGVYSILLIVQRADGTNLDLPSAQIVKCNEFPGMALQYCIEGKSINSPYYSVYEVKQGVFDKDRWNILTDEEYDLMDSISRFPLLSEFADVRQGFVTGNDDVFIRSQKVILPKEKEIYKKYLPDRKIKRYQIPRSISQYVFFPYIKNEALKESDLDEKFTETWKYLNENKSILSKGKSFASERSPWWRPLRPRDPKKILRPKIVCPHLILTPKFALDLKGDITVSRSPFIVSKSNENEIPLLKVLCAILNSSVCQWLISHECHKYSRGYYMLEVNVLKRIRVPDPTKISLRIMTHLISLVDSCVNNGPTPEIENEIDQIVFELYGLNKSQKEFITGEF